MPRDFQRDARPGQQVSSAKYRNLIETVDELAGRALTPQRARQIRPGHDRTWEARLESFTPDFKAVRGRILDGTETEPDALIDILVYTFPVVAGGQDLRNCFPQFGATFGAEPAGAVVPVAPVWMATGELVRWYVAFPFMLACPP